MSATLSRMEVEDFLYREALLIDQGDWDAWLALYCPEAVFWVPAWRDEQTPTHDPDSELSLIYYRGRRNLEDRVWRLRSGQCVHTPAACDSYGDKCCYQITRARRHLCNCRVLCAPL
jgi:3-phenylpropionate/cinnamic acid dioxygenase small subunit